MRAVVLGEGVAPAVFDDAFPLGVPAIALRQRVAQLEQAARAQAQIRLDQPRLQRREHRVLIGVERKAFERDAIEVGGGCATAAKQLLEVGLREVELCA